MRRKDMGSALLSFESKTSEPKQTRFINFRGGRITIHADSSDTAGQFALVEVAGSTGGEPPLHVHRNEDEFFLVLEGELKVIRGHEELTLKAGQSAFLPRNVAHTFKVASPHVRFLNTITPGGFEQFFRDMGQALNADGSMQGPVKPFSMHEMIRISGLYECTFMP
jgi:quercetin dioxygenase-like cupin family protein